MNNLYDTSKLLGQKLDSKLKSTSNQLQETTDFNKIEREGLVGDRAEVEKKLLTKIDNVKADY